MVNAIENEAITGAENVVWDLNPLYASVDDPAIDADIQAAEAKAAAFAKTYKGRVASLDVEEMMDAITDLEAIIDIQGRVYSYAALLHSTDTAEPVYGALMQKVVEFDARVDQQLVFFNLEWNQADDDQVATLLANFS